jgi:DNA-binding response OmpR family regulator
MTFPESEIEKIPMGAERILVVDDEESIREIVCSMLNAAGYQTRQAGSGVEALDVLSTGEDFALMLSDLMMRDLDGIGLLEQTKIKFPEMPVIMVTAVHDISVALAAIRNGAYDYLLKPFEREQLLAAVRRALETRRLKVENRAYQSNLESLVAARTEQLRQTMNDLERSYDITLEAMRWISKILKLKAIPSASPRSLLLSRAPWELPPTKFESSRAVRSCTILAKWPFLTPFCASPARSPKKSAPSCANTVIAVIRCYARFPFSRKLQRSFTRIRKDTMAADTRAA